MPGLGSSNLQTPGPYHTPGYGGFCPQFKYQIGETFGKTTSNLLKDSNVATSGRLVLGNINPGQSEEDKAREAKVEMLRTRTHSLGEQRLIEKMVPGYTGFIPRSQDFFGHRYAAICKNAISDFEFNHRHHIQKNREMREIEAMQRGKSCSPEFNLPPSQSRHITPLKPIATKAQPYISADVVKPSMSPYYMTNENPQKKFMSGYTGFVPRSRVLIGHGYPNITHQALNDFSDAMTIAQRAKVEPIKIHRVEVKALDTTNIYPIESGLVPHYTGHIPGQKSRYGETFGHSTANALNQTT